MAVTKAKKAAELKETQDIFASANTIVAAENKGLTVKAMSDLRNQARKEGAVYKVVKNALAKIAVKGTKFEGVTDLFKGPVGVIASEDPVAAARIAHTFAKESGNKFVILGGAMGDTAMDAKAVVGLASLPSLDALRAKILGVLQAPATKIACVVQAPAGQVARVIGAYSKKAA